MTLLDWRQHHLWIRRNRQCLPSQRVSEVISAEIVALPERRFPRAAAQTRIVSVARIRLDPPQILRPFKGIICGDVSEFECYMPSHAVWLCGICPGCRIMCRRGRQRADCPRGTDDRQAPPGSRASTENLTSLAAMLMCFQPFIFIPRSGRQACRSIRPLPLGSCRPRSGLPAGLFMPANFFSPPASLAGARQHVISPIFLSGLDMIFGGDRRWSKG
jgi:hypothetical protein